MDAAGWKKEYDELQRDFDRLMVIVKSIKKPNKYTFCSTRCGKKGKCEISTNVYPNGCIVQDVREEREPFFPSKQQLQDMPEGMYEEHENHMNEDQYPEF